MTLSPGEDKAADYGLVFSSLVKTCQPGVGSCAAPHEAFLVELPGCDVGGFWFQKSFNERAKGEQMRSAMAGNRWSQEAHFRI